MKQNERPRRLRRSNGIRTAVRQTILLPQNLIWPVFIKEGKKQREAIPSLPGCFRLSVDELSKDIRALKGLHGVALFPQIEDRLKDSKGKEATNPEGLVPRTVRTLKAEFPELLVITDVALDPYSSDGHDGLVKNGEILNDETLLVLGEQALTQAAAGADFVAPSDMMDGRVGWIRRQLDDNGFSNTGIISYCAKYASAFYGPFRDALASAPRFGDKKTYQMDPANKREALREARLDRKEGADILMVKPALAYLDIISAIRGAIDLPVAAYNVSGEYAMVKAAAENGWLDEKTVVLESLTAIKRAGADMIFSYHTPDALRWI